MIADEIARKKQKENEKRARRWATLLLFLLLLLFILPFMTGKVQARQRFDRVVEVQFEKPIEFSNTASSQRSSTRASSARRESPDPTPPPPEPAEQPVEQPVPEVEKPKPMEKVKPLTTVPNRKPILTSPTPEINLEVADMIGDISSDAQVSQVTPEITEVTEEVSGSASDKIADYFANSSEDEGGKVTDSSNDGPGSDGGEGTSGSSDTGDSNTDGQGDSGDDDFDGNGLLTRKVIRRAKLDGLIKQTGKVVINLCVNQDGKVIFAEADEYKSTIKDMGILQRAENTAAKYRYEKDYTVAKRQCGKLSFIVKLPK